MYNFVLFFFLLLSVRPFFNQVTRAPEIKPTSSLVAAFVVVVSVSLSFVSQCNATHYCISNCIVLYLLRIKKGNFCFHVKIRSKTVASDENIFSFCLFL